MAFLLAFFVVDVVHAQYEIVPIEYELPQDSCLSFQLGYNSYYFGCMEFYYSNYVASRTHFEAAVRYFEDHKNDHLQSDTRLLGYSYYYLFSICHILDKTENIGYYLKQALLYLHEDPIMESQAHCHYGEYLLWGDSLLGIEPDYCGALQEFDKAIKYNNMDFRDNSAIFQNYKIALSRHSMLLFNSYVNNKQGKHSGFNAPLYLYNVPLDLHMIHVPHNPKHEQQHGFIDNENILACDTCIGEQELDRCIDDLILLINLEHPKSEKRLIDTIALFLLGECYYYKDEYEKATDYYEKSGITPAQLVDLNGIKSVGLFLVSYLEQGKDNYEQYLPLLETFFESCRNNPDLLETFFELCRNNHNPDYDQQYRDVANDNNPANEAHIKMFQYICQEKYENALDYWFKIKNNFSFDYMLLMDQALCHICLGDFSAISDFTFAFEMMNREGLINDFFLSEDFSNGNDSPFIIIKSSLFDLAAYICYIEGNSAAAKAAKDYYLNLDQYNPNNKFMLAMCYKDMAENEHDPKMKNNLKNQSEEYFCDVINKEKSMKKFTKSPYAYLFLNEPDSAVVVMEYILKTELPSHILNEMDSLYCHDLHFEAAEIYAQVGNIKKAEYHLAKSLEYSSVPIMLAYTLNSPLLAPIQTFVEKEVDWHKKRFDISESRIRKDTIVCDIPFNRNTDYTKTVNCVINGEPIDDMLFDPGADKIQLTQAKAKGIGITTDDIIGTVKTKSANGEIVKKQLVSLKKVEIGDIVLENVQAYIDENNNAPLLLGCTVWNNLKVEMPSPVNKGMIRLTYIKESVEIPEKRTIDTDKQ